MMSLASAMTRSMDKARSIVTLEGNQVRVSKIWCSISTLHNEMRPRDPTLRALVCVHTSSHVL
jgi:hypothetical protein